MPHERNPDEVGALWEKTNQRGTYMTGTINGQPVVLFRNDRKAPGSKQPDWRVLKAQPRAERASAPAPADDDIRW
jgi:uncharacterized protein (DUF736 family)